MEKISKINEIFREKLQRDRRTDRQTDEGEIIGPPAESEDPTNVLMKLGNHFAEQIN